MRKRRRFYINWDESPEDRLDIWIYEELDGESRKFALVTGESPVESITKARMLVAALNIAQGVPLEKLEILPSGFLKRVMQK